MPNAGEDEISDAQVKGLLPSDLTGATVQSGEVDDPEAGADTDNSF